MILVVIPYHKAKRYSISHLLDWIEAQDNKDIDVVMKWHTGTYGETGIIKKQFNYFRDIFLAGDYTHMFIVEADTIPPVNAIEQLLIPNKDLISATYYYRDEAKNIVAWNIEDSEFLVKHCLGTGTGALLLSRAVLEKCDWNYDQVDADYPFFDQALIKGFQAYLHSGVVAKHYRDEEHYT